MILYGSRARGDATASSDWDLKVIVSDDAPILISPRRSAGTCKKVPAFLPMSPASACRNSSPI
ncbi:nucleotidyltransferase domain-containing protein [Sinorhizobium meliloti]|uniref:nucleotidyltransferase domain-containing protein n=1 Tax=Rhizobium meliloti TaxID=382 RepID=UPI000FDB1B1C|nr:nucleotidyltransferase domain-containing protein [Sinorhizobium meliloti]